jgi:hypothetical protein
MRRTKKKGRWLAPKASSSCSSSAHAAVPVVHGPPPSLSPRTDWSSGRSPSDEAQCDAHDEPAREGSSPGKSLGFPPDFVGSHSFPHFASRLSRLWSLPFSTRSSFSGGWFSSSFRPPKVVEEWPLLGRSSAA